MRPRKDKPHRLSIHLQYIEIPINMLLSVLGVTGILAPVLEEELHAYIPEYTKTETDDIHTLVLWLHPIPHHLDMGILSVQ